MHQIMWARWAEVAVEHELEARRALADVIARTGGEALLREFRASLVAVTAAAFAIEGIYGDVKYLIPAQSKTGKRRKDLVNRLGVAFGISDDDRTQLLSDLAWLFGLRDDAAHPYTESKPPVPHPSGANTGYENSLYNAVQCGRAIDVMMRVLGIAADPPKTHSRRIERWGEERKPYHDNVIAPLRQRRREIPISGLPADG
jgi:hypothetical protein